MGRTVFDISMSLDGFITAAHQSSQQPMGTRLFEDLPAGHVRLEPVDVLPTPTATHLRYRIVSQ